MSAGTTAVSPAFTPPCLARATPKPPRGDNWVHEIKFDGYRVQPHVNKGHVRLLTRNALDWTPRFGRVANDFAALRVSAAVLDCEAVVLDAAGVSKFSLLQSALKEGAAARIVFMAFDLIHLDGRDTSRQPLLDRKAALEGLISNATLPHGLLRFCAHMSGDGADILRNACAMHLEGLISKRTDLPYRSGRNGDWMKSKCVLADPFVVIGYAPSTATGGIVGSLVLGFYDKGELVYAGRVGSGFTIEEADAIADGLASIERKTAPVKKKLTREQRSGVRWVAPKLVAQVSYRDVTADGVLRHSTFEHFRSDKRPTEIGRPSLFRSSATD